MRPALKPLVAMGSDVALALRAAHWAHPVPGGRAAAGQVARAPAVEHPGARLAHDQPLAAVLAHAAEVGMAIACAWGTTIGACCTGVVAVVPAATAGAPACSAAAPITVFVAGTGSDGFLQLLLWRQVDVIDGGVWPQRCQGIGGHHRASGRG